MKEYPKIQTIFKRDPETKFKTLLEGEFSIPEFEYLKNNKWIFTEKVDGTNIRIGLKDDHLDIHGRTDNAQIPTFLLSKLVELFDLKKLKEIFEGDFCLYGEGYGAKIQKGGGNYRQDQSFVLFDIRIGDWWLQRKDIEDIAKKLNIDIVPVVGRGTLGDIVALIKGGFDSKWGNFLAEGIVARPAVELFSRNRHRIIAKLKYKDFLGR